MSSLDRSVVTGALSGIVVATLLEARGNVRHPVDSTNVYLIFSSAGTLGGYMAHVLGYNNMYGSVGFGLLFSAMAFSAFVSKDVLFSKADVI